MAISRKTMTEGIRISIFLYAFIDAVLQSLSQKSKIFASSTLWYDCHRQSW